MWISHGIYYTYQVPAYHRTFFFNFEFGMSLIISSPPKATYMRQRTGSALVQYGLSHVRCQVITSTNPGLLSIGLLAINLEWEFKSYSFKKMRLKLSFVKMAAILSRGRWVKMSFGRLSHSVISYDTTGLNLVRNTIQCSKHIGISICSNDYQCLSPFSITCHIT